MSVDESDYPHRHRIRSQDVDVRLNAIEQLGPPETVKGPTPPAPKRRIEREQVISAGIGSIADSHSRSAGIHVEGRAEEVRGEAFSALLQIGYHRAQFMPPDAQGDSSSDPRMALTQIAWPADMDAIQILLTSTPIHPEIRIAVRTHWVVSASERSEELVFLLENDADSRCLAAFAMYDLGNVAIPE